MRKIITIQKRSDIGEKYKMRNIVFFGNRLKT